MGRFWASKRQFFSLYGIWGPKDNKGNELRGCLKYAIKQNATKLWVLGGGVNMPVYLNPQCKMKAISCPPPSFVLDQGVWQKQFILSWVSDFTEIGLHFVPLKKNKKKNLSNFTGRDTLQLIDTNSLFYLFLAISPQC